VGGEILEGWSVWGNGDWVWEGPRAGVGEGDDDDGELWIVDLALLRKSFFMLDRFLVGRCAEGFVCKLEARNVIAGTTQPCAK
jgi:hypothetical protein